MLHTLFTHHISSVPPRPATAAAMSAPCRAARLATRPLLTRRLAAAATSLRTQSVCTLRTSASAHQSSTSSTLRSALLAGIILACGAVTLSQSGVVWAKEEAARAQKTPVADHNHEMVPDEGLEERNKKGQARVENCISYTNSLYHLLLLNLHSCCCCPVQLADCPLLLL